MDVVWLWRVSKAHSCLPDVLTTVDGVDIFCCVLWGEIRRMDHGGQRQDLRALVGIQGSSATLFSNSKKINDQEQGPR